MNTNKTGLAIVLHSGSYDRIYHGLSFATTAAALGRDVKLFFTYWALKYLKREGASSFELDEEGEAHRALLEKNLKNGDITNIKELLIETKAMGAEFYSCSASMAMLNIARDELAEEVDKSMGITSFLTETTDYQILFI